MKFETTFKKSLAFVLAMALLLSTLLIPGMMVSAEDEIEIWDGTVATSFAGGTGTAEDPYIIENGSQLAFAIQYNTTDNSKYNKHFALANDIYLNDITKIDWATGEVEEGYTPTTWIHSGIKDGNSGYIYGNGHAVYGLYINEPEGTGRYGLVPLTWNGVKFYDMGMDYTYINTKGAAGFFIGYGKSSSSTYSEFENCWVGENSTMISAGSASGFVYGPFKYVTFKNCYSLASVTSTASGGKAAAFAGDVWGGPTMWFENCYALGAFYKNHGGAFTNCYSTAQTGEGMTVVDAANMKGASAQKYMPMLGADFAVTDSYPVFKTQTDKDAKYWGGFIAAPADADENGEYEIYTPEELAWYAKNGGSAKLMNDLWLNDLKVTITDGTPVLTKASDTSALEVGDTSLLEWFGTGTALGATDAQLYTLNGDGNIINGLYYNQPGDGTAASDFYGIFNSVSSETSIYGVGIENCYMVTESTWAAACLIGRANGVYFTADSCYAGASVYHEGYDVAVICGGGAANTTTPSTVKNCYSLATLNGSHRANALIADNWSDAATTYSNCYTVGYPVYRKGITVGGVYSKVALADIQGAKGQTKMPDLGEAFTVTSGVPVLKVFQDQENNIWCGYKSAGFASGTGTAEDPYMITNGEELARAINFRDKVESETGTYIFDGWKYREFTAADYTGTKYKYDSSTETYTKDASGTYLLEGETYREITIDDYTGIRYSNTDVHSYYKLANDIYLNDVSKIDWATGAVADGYVARSWYANTAVLGNFDGDGHVVYGMYYYGNNGQPGTSWSNQGVALFPRVSDGTTLNISNMGIDNAFVSHAYGAGAFVASNSASNDTVDSYLNVNDSYVGENVTLIGYDTGAAIAVNRAVNTTVTDFYSLASQTADSRTGIISDIWGGSGKIIRSYNGKGALDSKNVSSCTNSYATATGGSGAIVLSADAMQGKKALVTMYGLGDKFVTTEGYPVLALFNQPLDEDLNVELGTSPFSGAGTEADPYLISTAEDLRNMVGLGGEGAYYKLTNDIYVNDVNAVDWLTGTVNEGYTPEEWFYSTNISGVGYTSYISTNTTFTGTIDGDGYAIHGLYYPVGNVYVTVGLLPYATDTTVKNLGIEDSFIGGGRFVGGMVGYGTANFDGCYVDDSCAVWFWDAGAYYATPSTVSAGSGNQVMGTLTTTYELDENGTLMKVETTEEDGTVTTTYETITDEAYEGDRYTKVETWSNVHFTSDAIGGLMGRYNAAGTINNCYVTADVNNHPLTGFGKNNTSITITNDDTFTTSSGHMGGLWGDDWDATVSATDCFSVIKPHESNGFDATKTTLTDIYTLGDGSPAGVNKISNAQGNCGLDEMSGLDTEIWYAINDSVDYPQFTLRGTVIGDVNENGIGAEMSDVECLRETIIGFNNFRLTDFSRDGETDICDLVKLSIAANEKAAAKEEETKNLLASVYVSSEGSDENAGTSDAPVKTLTRAYELVQDKGYINVVDTATVSALPKGDKLVNIAGGTVDMSSLSEVNFGCDTYFGGNTIIFADDATVYANGNDLLIPENVTVQGIPAAIYGGGNSAVTETYLDLRSGSYKAIYGGGDKGAVLGNTCLYLFGTVNAELPLTEAGSSYVYGGGNTGTVYGGTVVSIEGEVNAPLDHTSHTAIARLYGGSKNGDVKGYTWVTVSGNAEFNYIYGGCASGTVGGSTTIDFSGYAMSIYGGSGTVTETNVNVYGGWVHQVFGGCEGSSMTGDTNVTIMGGTIDRRIVGGCYNDFGTSGWASENYVTGTCTVTINSGATYNNNGDDYGITAQSRHGTNHSDENAVMIFESESLKNSLTLNLVGKKYGITLFTVSAYDSYSVAE